MSNENDADKPCWFYVDAEPITGFREVMTKLQDRDINTKETALETILGSITNDDNYPDNLMISVLHYITIVDDIRLKKLVFLFWEVNLLVISGNRKKEQ